MDAQDLMRYRPITVDVTENGCHNVVSHTTDNKGYPFVRIRGKFWLLSRLTCTLVYGEIPEGLVVMHLCDNPLCININHLKIATQRENIYDAISKGRMKPGRRTPFTVEEKEQARIRSLKMAHLSRGENNSSAKLTEQAVREIRTSPLGCRHLARQYGVHENTIMKIRNRERWAHVE